LEGSAIAGVLLDDHDGPAVRGDDRAAPAHVVQLGSGGRARDRRAVGQQVRAWEGYVEQPDRTVCRPPGAVRPDERDVPAVAGPGQRVDVGAAVAEAAAGGVARGAALEAPGPFGP